MRLPATIATPSMLGVPLNAMFSVVATLTDALGSSPALRASTYALVAASLGFTGSASPLIL